MFDYLKMAMREAKRQKEYDKKKARLLSQKMDYQFLEEIIQKVNENPQLNVRITLSDHTILDVNTRPKPKNMILEDVDFEEVR